MEKKRITLDDIKARPLVEIAWKGYMDLNLDPWNISVYRNRMKDASGIAYNISNIVQNGNEPRDNEEMLDVARWYIEKGVYTDEEWEKYFIPAINEMVDYNDAFVRWMPGTVIRHRKDGRMFVVEYDYAAGFGSSCGRKCRDYTSLSLVSLYPDGHVGDGWAWARYGDFELVDAGHCRENIARIRDYHVAAGHRPPFYLDSDIENMYYR